ncbi:MAG: alpha/beta fold hydrolase [Caulobacteraceae bacterium]
MRRTPRAIAHATMLLAAAVSTAVLAAPRLPTDAEPHPLHVDCRGERTNAPTVILESGAFGTSADWDRVLPDLARAGRVCAYDRAGVGDSPPRAGGEDVVSIAHELRGLLDALGETRPVILVGHSNGALYAETFAAMWPERVAGLVYVNGVGSDDLDSRALLGDLAGERQIADLAAETGDLGLARPFARMAVSAEHLSPNAAARKFRFLTNVRGLRVARDEDRAIVPGLAIPRELGGPPPSIPVVVIVGATQPRMDIARAWRMAEIAPANRARLSLTLDAVGATHVSPLARDRAWIVAAVDWLRSLPRPDVGH